MKLWLDKAKDHLASQNETYWEHMIGAWKIIWTLKILELKCLVHSFFPFFFTAAVSEKIECLKKMTNRNK